MQWLNTSYTVWFNRRHQRTGHVLQGRFKAIVVEADRWALGLSRYIHSWGGFRDRRGDWGRELALYLGREQGGMTLAELGHAVEGKSVMAMSLAIRRFRSRLSTEKSLRKIVAQAGKKLEEVSQQV